MPDLTKCTNNRCVKKLECYRFTSVPSSANQAFDIFVPDVNLRDGFRCDMMYHHVFALAVHGDLFIDMDRVVESAKI